MCLYNQLHSSSALFIRKRVPLRDIAVNTLRCAFSFEKYIRSCGEEYLFKSKVLCKDQIKKLGLSRTDLYYRHCLYLLQFLKKHEGKSLVEVAAEL